MTTPEKRHLVPGDPQGVPLSHPKGWWDTGHWGPGAGHGTRDSGGTPSLKTIANSTLLRLGKRDTQRDTERDKGANGAKTAGHPAGHLPSNPQKSAIFEERAAIAESHGCPGRVQAENLAHRTTLDFNPAEPSSSSSKTKRQAVPWDPETATLIEWFLKTPPPAEPFELHQGVTVFRPEGFWNYLKGDIAAGPGKARACTGAFQKDLRRLAELFGGPVAVGVDCG